MQKFKSEKLNKKIKNFFMVPIIASSIFLSCVSIQKKEEIGTHNIKDAISFVRNEADKKMLNKATLLMNVHGANIHYFKEYSQTTPKELKYKRKINVYDSISFLVRATQDNFIYVSDEENKILGYVTLYEKHNSNYHYNSDDSISFIPTSIGELIIKVYSPEDVPKEVKLFYSKIISESVISFLYSTKHLKKNECEKIVNEIWEN